LIYTSLVNALTQDDDTHRKQMVASVLAQGDVRFLRAVASRLLRFLTSRNTVRRQQARATLIDFGISVIPALTHELCTSRSVKRRIQVAELLGVIGEKLEPIERANLYCQLDVVICTARQREVVEAVMKAVAVPRGTDKRIGVANLESAVVATATFDNRGCRGRESLYPPFRGVQSAKEVVG
jgi:hypothetical protein